jgi:hypothetical protein
MMNGEMNILKNTKMKKIRIAFANEIRRILREQARELGLPLVNVTQVDQWASQGDLIIHNDREFEVLKDVIFRLTQTIINRITNE